MISRTIPRELLRLRFEAPVLAADGEFEGEGRLSFRPYERANTRLLDLRLGRTNLTAELTGDRTWRELRLMLDEQRHWFGRVSNISVHTVEVSLFGLADVLDIGELGLTPLKDPTFDAIGDLADLRARFAQTDSWSGRNLLLVSGDLQNGGLRIVGVDDEASLQLGDDCVYVEDLVARTGTDPLTKWLLLVTSGEPFQSESTWDAVTLSRLTTYTTGLGDFLTVWRSYMESEERLLHDLRDDLGDVRFGKTRDSGAGETKRIVTIRVGPHEPSARLFLDKLALRHSEGHQLSLEMTERVADIDDVLPGTRHRRGSSREPRLVGRVESVNLISGDIDLHVLSNDPPIGDGWCRISIQGDLVQIGRRREALERLQGDAAGIPALRPLLAEGGAPPVARLRQLRSPVGALSPAGGFTDRQRRAIEIALTTPDIALIQGPPGTGKTKVITAIEESLAELEGPNRSSRLVLLTSTQNDAVDQVAVKTRIFGLPPYRDGRGAIDPIADWRRERLVASIRVLDADTEHRINSFLSDTYARLSGTELTTEEVIASLNGLAGQDVERSIRRQASELVDDLQGRRLKHSRRQRLEQRIRALRDHPESHADDGADRLRDVRGELSDRRLPPVWADRFATRANEINPDATDAWLSVRQLKQDLLDFLAAQVDDRPTAAPTVVLDLFAHAIGAAKASSRSQSGAPLTVGEAMATYIEDIEQRPSAADEAIRKYTVVYAATCQRSSQYFLPFGQGSNAAGFENAIVDEAARVSPLDLIIPLVQAKQRVILVGDHRQLPAVYDESIARGLAQADLLSKSQFERLFERLQELDRRTGIQRTITLDRQFRMHPRLGAFVSRVFYEPYGDRVDSGLEAGTFAHDLPDFEGRTSVWIDVPHHSGKSLRSDRKSWSRRCEAERVAAIVSALVHARPDTSVGVITFYGDQRDLILEMLHGDLSEIDGDGTHAIHRDFRLIVHEDGSSEERLRVGTVDAFQGKEFDVVILSMVRSERPSVAKAPGAVFGFLTVENRFCVALSRQKKLLIVVGDRAMTDLPQAEAITGLRELRELCDEETASA